MKLDIKNYPLVLKIICGLVLLPILAAPLVFYATIFSLTILQVRGGIFMVLSSKFIFIDSGWCMLGQCVDL